MTNLFEVFQEVLTRLEENSLPYMVVGSIASIVYGEPRMTKDMDIVVNTSPQDSLTFEKIFPMPEYYCPPKEVVIDEVIGRGQFNLIHPSSGLKIDIVIRKNNAHSVEEFNRRKRITLWQDFEAFIATPEDIIIKKLQFYEEGLSEKHLIDIRGILSQTTIDNKYLDSWITKLNLKDSWKLI